MCVRNTSAYWSFDGHFFLFLDTQLGESEREKAREKEHVCRFVCMCVCVCVCLCVWKCVSVRNMHMHTHLFYRYIGLFSNYTGLFYRYIGLILDTQISFTSDSRQYLKKRPM